MEYELQSTIIRGIKSGISKMANKGKKSSGTNSSGLAEDASETDNVDKIRDILFGNQMREVDKRFAGLEKTLAADLAALRKDNAMQIDSLKSYIESEVEIVGSKLAAEEKARIDDADELDARLKQQVKQIDGKLADLSKALDKAAREINQKLLKQSQDFSKELSQQIGDVRERMDQQREALGAGKVDKAMLAEVLSALALQVNADESK